VTRHLFILASILAATAPSHLGAQTPPPIPREVLQENSLPPEIRAALRNAQPISLFNIGTETLDKNVIIADKVVWNEGAVAQLGSLDWPYVIIFGKEFLFADPEAGAQLLRALNVKATVPATPTKPATPPAAGRSGRNGNNGTNGRNGTDGATGQTTRIPDIWLITNHIGTQGTSSPTSTKVKLRIHVPGVAGGDGGRGGDGGDGGQGGSGRNGETRYGVCSRGAGGGGNGGAAGSGGRGGNGGAGGDGGRVFYVGPGDVIDVLQYASVSNTGAKGGSPGQPGNPGNPGNGGSRGSHPGNCNGPGPGVGGPPASPANLGPGDPGVDGKKGTTTAYVVSDVSSLLTR